MVNQRCCSNLAARRQFGVKHLFLFLIMVGMICGAIYNATLDSPLISISANSFMSFRSPAFFPARRSPSLLPPTSDPWNGIGAPTQCTPTLSHNSSLNGTGRKCACAPQTTIAFIKTLKTGSMTLQSIINRFGFFNNLSFIFNKQSSKNGHFYHLPFTDDAGERYLLPPVNVSAGDYKRYRNYDIVAVHVRYNRKVMDRYLAPDAKYITIIRDPASQWESAYNHFKFHDGILLNISSNSFKSLNSSQIPTFAGPTTLYLNDSIAFRKCSSKLDRRKMFNSNSSWGENCSIRDLMDEFLRKPHFYRERLKLMDWEGELGRRYHYSRNLQIFDLGFNSDQHDNITALHEWIKRLHSEFALVLINEYYDESLLVLRKMFSWSYEDITYVAKNVRLRVEGADTSDADFKRRVREWNNADRDLYDHFNRTLWNLIRHYGPTFDADLAYFRSLLDDVKRNCTREGEKMLWDKTGWFGHRELIPIDKASLFCQTVAESKESLHRRIYCRQQGGNISQPYCQPPKSRRTRSYTPRNITAMRQLLQRRIGHGRNSNRVIKTSHKTHNAYKVPSIRNIHRSSKNKYVLSRKLPGASPHL